MWDLDDSDFNVVGEHYVSLSEFFVIQKSRGFNSVYSKTGDSWINELIDADETHQMTLKETQRSVLWGSDLFFERIKEEYERLRPDLERLESREELIGSSNTWDVVGSAPSVPRALSGYPRAMLRRTTPRRERVIDITYSLDCAWYIPTKDRVAAGCMLLALVELFEQHGYRIALTWAVATDADRFDKYPSTCCEIELKGYGTRVDPYACSFPLAAKAPLFHIGCWWARRFPRQPVNYGRGEGYSCTYTSKEKITAWMRHRKAVWISMAQTIGWTPERMFDHIVEELYAIRT